MPKAPPRIALAPDLEISRVVVGLWQIADMERGGRSLDPEAASSAMLDYARAGFDSFDMADHYGTAELIAGRFLSRVAGGEAAGQTRPAALTKWCPTPGPMTADIVRDGVERSRKRLGVETIDLLQFHWWAFEHPAYLDAVKGLGALRREGLIRHLGVTNFDTAHLRVLVKHGIPVVSNQVSFSLLDRRAAGEMSAFCLENGVRLLAYGTLAGGLMSERWLGRPEPARDEIADWSKMKYKRFVDAAGGWGALQAILRALDAIAKKHGVSIANVGTRWTLDHPAVAAAIVGARLGQSDHADDNLRLFSFALDEDDRARIGAALSSTTPIAGDCGDEYRRPPFLTASGDLSDHLDFDAEGLSGFASRRAAGTVAGLVRQRLRTDRRLQPRSQDRRPGARQRHDRDQRRRRNRLSRRCRRTDDLHPRQDRRQPRGARGRSRRRCAHARLSFRRKPLGTGLARARPALWISPTSQYDGRDRQADWRLSG